MNRRDAINLDNYLTASLEDDEEDNYCELCGCVARECELTTEHAAQWVLLSEHVQAEIGANDEQ